MTKLIVAIDATDYALIQNVAKAVGPFADMIKVGLEMFSCHGIYAVSAMRHYSGRPVLLDLKLHDIPETVGRTVNAICKQAAPEMMTVHASGGAAMVAAAVKAAQPYKTKIIAVTVLTSLRQANLARMDVDVDIGVHAIRLARQAMLAGAHGITCSPHEVVGIKWRMGADCVTVVPALRSVGADPDDQARVATIENTVSWGADYLVVGRRIRDALDHGAEAAKVRKEMGYG